jgi:nicotinamidase-related amidase
MANQSSKEDVYDQAGMSDNYVGFGDRPAVLVIDIQNGMTDPENPIGAKLDGMVESANEIVETAHDVGVPVLFTTAVTRDKSARDMGVFAEKIPALKTLKEGSKWVEIDDRLDFREDEDYLIKKQQQSAFHGTELHSMLTAWGIDSLIVTGCSTSGCVRATVFDAVANGFRTTIPAEAVGDRSTEQHKSNLFEMGAKNADVRPVSEVIDHLRSATRAEEAEA